jgi:hypothetical protein
MAEVLFIDIDSDLKKLHADMGISDEEVEAMAQKEDHT